MILCTAEERLLNLSESVLLGDKMSDIEGGCVAAIGCCVLVMSGHQLDPGKTTRADHAISDIKNVASDLADKMIC